MVLLIETEEKFKEQIKANKIVVVDFYADWCGPCRKIAPEIEKLSEEHTEVVFLKINVDNLESITEEYNVTAMPTFLFFVNGERVSDADVIGANLVEIKKSLDKVKAM